MIPATPKNTPNPGRPLLGSTAVPTNAINENTAPKQRPSNAYRIAVTLANDIGPMRLPIIQYLADVERAANSRSPPWIGPPESGHHRYLPSRPWPLTSI